MARSFLPPRPYPTSDWNIPTVACCAWNAAPHCFACAEPAEYLAYQACSPGRVAGTLKTSTTGHCPRLGVACGVSGEGPLRAGGPCCNCLAGQRGSTRCKHIAVLCKLLSYRATSSQKRHPATGRPRCHTSSRSSVSSTTCTLACQPSYPADVLGTPGPKRAVRLSGGQPLHASLNCIKCKYPVHPGAIRLAGIPEVL